MNDGGKWHAGNDGESERSEKQSDNRIKLCDGNQDYQTDY
jgi:hypothetical protein